MHDFPTANESSEFMARAAKYEV
jgi:hypothetical protein